MKGLACVIERLCLRSRFALINLGFYRVTCVSVAEDE